MLKQGMILKAANRSGEMEIVELIGWLDHARIKLPTGDEVDASIDALIEKIECGDYEIISQGMESMLGDPVAVRVGDTSPLEAVGPLSHQESANIFAQALSWMLKPNEGIAVRVGSATYGIINDSQSKKMIINKIDGNIQDGQMLYTGDRPVSDGPFDDDDDD